MENFVFPHDIKTKLMEMNEEHTWASSKSPGEGVQFFFSRGGLIFNNTNKQKT